jgi:hypothetical protein
VVLPHGVGAETILKNDNESPTQLLIGQPQALQG